MLVLILPAATAQVGLNNDGSLPDPSAILDIKTTTLGMLPPRMNTMQRDSLSAPEEGLLIYNIDCQIMQFFNGSGWVPMANQGSLSTPGVITGNPVPCIPATGFVYSVAPVPWATGYHWTVPHGSVITAGQGTTAITVTFGSQNGAVCVSAYNTCNRRVAGCLDISLTPPGPAGIVISANANPVCAGTQVTFTSTIVNGGPSPQYQWRVNGTPVGGATGSSYVYTPLNGDIVTCVLTSNSACATVNPVQSNPLTMTVNPVLPVSVSVSASANPVCATTTVLFTATPVNGGSNPSYQWVVNGSNVAGATGSTYSYVPLNSDQVKCILTSSATCKSGSPAVSNVIALTVNPLIQVSVSIWASKYAVSSGTSVTYRATPVNGGSSPVFQWKVNDQVVGTNSPSYTFVPANNDVIKVIMTSGAPGCLVNNPATSNQIVGVVYTTGTVCSGTPTVTYNGKTYNTVKIGNQCWLRESLDVGTRINNDVNQSNNSVPEKYCYDNDTMNCNVYGGLYQWAEMVQYYNGATNTSNWNPVPTGNVQGICPPGWHIPSSAEFTTLFTFLGGTSVAAGPMKQTGTGHWFSPNVGATNSSGFTSLPGGFRSYSTGGFSNIGVNVNFWTKSQPTPPTASVALYWGNPNVAVTINGGQGFKTTGYSVRCLKD